MTKIKQYLSSFFLVVIFLLLGSSVHAIGVGVRPEKINLDVRVGQKIETEILVMNVASQPAIYQIYPDALEKNITVSPNEFQLNPQGTQAVKVTVKINTLGKFATNLSVVARPLSAGGLSAVSGIKIPVTVTTSGVPFWWITLGIVIVGLVILIIKRIKPQKTL